MMIDVLAPIADNRVTSFSLVSGRICNATPSVMYPSLMGMILLMSFIVPDRSENTSLLPHSYIAVLFKDITGYKRADIRMWHETGMRLIL